MIERQGSPRHRVIGKVVIKQRYAGRQNLIRTGHIAEGVYIHGLELVAVDAQGTIGSNHVGVVYDLAAHVPLSPERVLPETNCIPEIGMYSVGLGVHEIDAHVVGRHADNVELDKLQVLEMAVIGNVSALVGKRLECLTVWNGTTPS